MSRDMILENKSFNSQKTFTATTTIDTLDQNQQPWPPLLSGGPIGLQRSWAHPAAFPWYPTSPNPKESPIHPDPHSPARGGAIIPKTPYPSARSPPLQPSDNSPRHPLRHLNPPQLHHLPDPPSPPPHRNPQAKTSPKPASPTCP